jgi:putative hemolysin
VTTDLFLKIFRIRRSVNQGVTEEEIKAIVKEGMEFGEVQAIEQNIVNRVFSVGDRTVSSLMTSRKKMIVLNIDDSKEEIKARIAEDLHNIYPVYDHIEQDIIGIVSLKKLFSEIEKETISLKNIYEQASYIAETASAYQALDHFKQSSIHYALVVDEFGSTQGIITMSDILEALVGDISEFYGEEFLFQQRDENSWLIDGQYPLPDFLSKLGMEGMIKDYEVNTVGGLIMHELGRIPKPLEKLLWSGFEIEIVDMDGPSIDKVMVTRK